MNMITVLGILAQVKKLDSDTPRVDPGSSFTTWVIIGVVLVGVLLISFKTSRRNNNLLEE